MACNLIEIDYFFSTMHELNSREWFMQKRILWQIERNIKHEKMLNCATDRNRDAHRTNYHNDQIQSDCGFSTKCKPHILPSFREHASRWHLPAERQRQTLSFTLFL